MSAFEIRESQVLKKDACFQLQRVFTRSGDEFLVKLAATDDRCNEERLIEREFQLLRSIGSEYGLTSIRLERLDGRLAAIYQAFDGLPLAPRGSAIPLEPGEISEFVRGLSAILAALHRQGMVLLGVSPSSFLRNPRTHRILLADAPFAQPQGTPIDKNEAYWFESPYLVYAAPEVIRGGTLTISQRADLYSLGSLLYHLISHRPLFDAVDPAEIIQCQLAREPRHLRELVPSLSEGLANAVMRLLAKNPVERFSSVEAFTQEIRSCIEHLGRRDTGLDEQAYRPRPVVPPFSAELYGHDDALHAMREKVRTVRSAPAMVLLEGDAGVGKTTLLREVRRREPHAYFCGGGFSQTGPAEPLGGWTSALIDLANVVLTSRLSELEVWRARIQEQLGEWAPLIGAMAVEWQKILRCPTPLAQDPLDTSLERLALAIRRLIGCYADEESPVVVILDDLQWADTSSLRILEILFAAPEPVNLLVFATVRDENEASAEASALRGVLDRLRAAGADVATIHLGPWSERDVLGFVVDSLGGEVEDAGELAALILAKTHGNPFFVRELLRSLLQQGAIDLRPGDSRWRWNEQALRRLPVTDNVVAFRSVRIERLPADLKAAVQVCACLGRELSLSNFSLVNEQLPAESQELLERAVAEGLLVRRDGGSPGGEGANATGATQPAETIYEFVHDRVLEAVRGLLSSHDLAAIHLRIGRVLSRDARVDVEPGSGADEDRIYKVASHFNLARDLIEERQERFRSAELNLRAGRLAKLRGAFSQALDFLRAGLEFLTARGDAAAHQTAWRDRFPLTLSLHEETAELALLNGQLPLMGRLCDAILARVASPLQKVLAYELRICGLKAEKRFSAAVDTALEILSELGVKLPSRPMMLHVVLGYIATKRRVFAGPVARLADVPTLRDGRVKAAGRIIQSVYSAAYLGRPKLFPFFVFRHVNDSLEHGNEEYSGVTYTAFGVLLSAFAHFGSASQLGDVGLGLVRRFNADRLKARVFTAYYSFIFPWQNHIRETLPYYREGLEAGLAYGDFEYASYLMTFDSLARLHAGDPLADLQPAFERHSAKIKSLGQERSIVLQNMLCQVVYALRCGAEREKLLSGRFYDEAKELPRCLDPLDENLAFHHYLAKVMLGVFFGEHASTVGVARGGRVHLKNGGLGNYLVAMFITYESLACLISAPGKGRTRAVMRLVKRNQRLLKKWARGAPMNFLHKYHLVEAERCRWLGHAARAAEHFEKAIELSQAHGFVHETGLAQERAASFCFDRGMDRLGRQYLRDGYLSYRKWGADAVTQRLEAEYAQHFAILTNISDGLVKRAGSGIAENLDYRMLLESSQAISGEILLPRLLERLLQAILEHTGAQRAILVLAKEKDKHLYVEAEADVDKAGAQILGREAVEESGRLCRAIVHYSARMSAPVVLADAAREGVFVEDAYVRERRPKSILCTPILHQGKLVGLVYLENNRMSRVFTSDRLEVVNLLAGQAAISIQNARFHALELEAQQAKINPHFLFNALSSIADLAVSDGSNAETAIVKLASLYRYILTNTRDELVTLEQELEIVRNYLILEKLRYGAKLQYAVTTEGDVAGVRLPGLLIQPLVENGIRHGVSPKLSPGKVWVHAAVRGNRCCIAVQDDGEGGKQGTSGTGFGLKSIQERLALAYGQDFSFAISRPGGYRVEIEIPAAG